MSEIGKSIRMERIVDGDTKRTVIVALDHGLTVGPVEGIIDLRKTIHDAARGGANAVILHNGMIRSGYGVYMNQMNQMGIIIHLSAGTNLAPDPNNKVLVGTVEEALRKGADAVSIHVNLGASSEGSMLHALGSVSERCEFWGIPLVAMMYPRGEKIGNENGVDVELVKHAARVGGELGADLVKTSYTGDPDSFKEVVRGCPVPVVGAGGPKTDKDEDFLSTVKGVMEAGGSGVAVGRNVFQTHSVADMVKAVAKIVHENWEVEDAVKIIE